jgi:hypothetical protein
MPPMRVILQKVQFPAQEAGMQNNTHPTCVLFCVGNAM